MEENVLWADINNSSHLSKIGYNIQSSTLYIEFLNGEIYKYNNVPSSKVLILLNSASAGSYFWEEIRDNYSFEKV